MSTSKKAFVAFWIAALYSRVAVADPAEAEHLFERGVTDLLAGRYALACPALQQSYDIDPRPGVMFTLAECLAGAGNLATAFDRYADFRTLLSALPSQSRLQFAEREDLAIKKMQALNELVPDLTIDVTRGAPADLVVTSNGKIVQPAAYGVRVRVDPGDYVVEAHSSGTRVWQRRVELGEKAHARVVVPWPAPGVARSPGSVAAGAPARQPPPVKPEDAGGRAGNRRAWTLALGGVGVAGLAVGGVAGVIALSKKSDIDRECPAYVCSPGGHDAVETARTAATVSTIGVAVGVAGLTGALAVWLLAKDPERESSVALLPSFAPTAQGGLALNVRGFLP